MCNSNFYSSDTKKYWNFRGSFCFRLRSLKIDICALYKKNKIKQINYDWIYFNKSNLRFFVSLQDFLIHKFSDKIKFQSPVLHNPFFHFPWSNFRFFVISSDIPCNLFPISPKFHNKPLDDIGNVKFPILPMISSSLEAEKTERKRKKVVMVSKLIIISS